MSQSKVFTYWQRKRIKDTVEKNSYTKYGYSRTAFAKAKREQAKLYGVTTQMITRVVNGEKV